jgi:hypothetical protein
VKPFLCGARRRSVLGLRSAFVLLCGFALYTTNAAAQQDAYEEGLIEVAADRLPPLTVIMLVDSAGSVLLPVEQITAYLGLGGPGAERDILVPWIGGATARLDTVTASLVLPDRTLQLAPAELVRRDAVVYLRAGRLARLIEADVNVDFAALTVTIARAVPFPAQQRIIAEQRRALLLARQRWLEARALRSNVPYAPLTGGAVLDWEVATATLDPARLTTLRAQGGAALLGGNLHAGAAMDVGRDSNEDVRDATLQFHRVFPRNRYLTQLRAGDIVTSGVFGRYVRGVEVGNRPFMRSDELGAILIQPDLPAGWEFEVFQGNQLIGFSEPATGDAIAVRLRAGATPLQVRMFGPAGEEITRTLLYQTPVSMLRIGTVEYAVAAGHCSVACDEYAHADVRYGATSLVTAGAGFELIRDSTGQRVRPYAVSSLSTGTRATAELTLMPAALYAANIALFPREGSAAHVRASLSRPGFGPISQLVEVRRRWDVEATFDERLDRAARVSSVRLGASAGGLTGSLQRWRLSSVAAFRTGYVETRYDHDNTAQHPHLLSTRAAIFTPVTLRTRRIRPLVSSTLGLGHQGVRLAELAVSLQPTGASVLNASVQWTRDAAQPTLSLSYSARTAAAFAALRAVSSASGARSSSLLLSGSTALSPDGHVTFTGTARTGYAGISGIVFVDNDGDGVFSSGDDIVPGVDLVIGGLRVSAGSDGRFRAWGLQPYQPISVAIDSARSDDPGLTTAHNEIVVRPVPNMARTVHLPLVRTRELIGSVSASERMPAGGITLDILDLDSGTTLTTVTFSDGFFYVSRVRPGRYRITISAASLDALGATAGPPLEFAIPRSGDDVAIELPPIEMRRR